MAPDKEPKLIVSPAAALDTAARSDPAPESAVVVTVCVAARATPPPSSRIEHRTPALSNRRTPCAPAAVLAASRPLEVGSIKRRRGSESVMVNLAFDLLEPDN